MADRKPKCEYIGQKSAPDVEYTLGIYIKEIK